MSFTLPKLPYPKDALAPHLSAETFDYHYEKHHKSYVDNLNKLIPGSEFENESLEQIIQKSSGAIFNNAAQVWNHTFFWHCLSPQGGGTPDEKLLDRLNSSFGSLETFKEKFTDACVKQFGSGWGWLVLNKNGKLEITSTSNAMTPLKDGQRPLLTCDVWEHAYYIDYRNRRPDFVQAFWNIVNWNFVSENLHRA